MANKLPSKAPTQTAPAPSETFEGAPKGKERAQYTSLVIIGPSGYGKSSLVDELVQDYVKRGGQVAGICDPAHSWPGHPARFWPGIADLDASLTRFKTPGKPGMLIFDDADLYFRHPTAARQELIVANRHWQKDVVMIARRPQGIPKDMFGIIENIAIFSQREPYARAYLSDALGDPKIVREIPQEKFRFLYVNIPTGHRAVYSTVQRATTSAADMR